MEPVGQDPPDTLLAPGWRAATCPLLIVVELPVRGTRPLSKQRIYAENRSTACSFQATPVPKTPLTVAIPCSICSGSAITGFHQSTYSRKCAVGVAHISCILISGHKWFDSGIP